MYKIATATYNNNALKIDEKLDFCEGKRLKVIIIDEEKKKKDNFLEFVKRSRINIPKDYKFNRDELHER
ncbi:MAG TPA: DUF104 domain-containing protein [Candidatus Cloacimonetes bacterium]|nr:DUF104 domain-containing protein [Candidatus Cloacimonadota bacterium]